MRIGIDARAASHPQRGGFKTYAEGLIQGLAAIGDDHEYVLYVDRAYGQGRALPRNARVRVVASGPRLIGAGWREQVILPRFMRQDGCQVAHFLGNTAPSRVGCPLIVTIHDLIPVLHSSRLPAGARPADLYQYLIRSYSRVLIDVAARAAQTVITDSQASRTEILDHYGLPPQRVVVVPLAQSGLFKPQPPAQAREVVAREFGIRGDYILTIGSSDPRKNVRAAIEAFLELAPELQERFALVVVLAHGALRERLAAQAASRGLLGRVVFLDSQPHEKLAWLYSAASLFLFLSLSEGFGMPVIEAMACGTPVITSNLSSLPEVAGTAAMLVDPREPRGVVYAIGSLLCNPAMAQDLRAKGLQQAGQYSWERTARETVAVYETQRTER